MTAFTYWNDSVAVPNPLENRAAWSKVSKGLKLFQVGFLLLLTFGFLGLFFGWLVLTGTHPARLPGADHPDEDVVLLLVGAILMGLPGLLGAVLVGAGYWLCRHHLPPRQSSRHFMDAWMLLLLAALGLGIAGMVGDGGHNYLVLQQGLGGLRKLRLGTPGGLAQFFGFALCLVSFYPFNLFLRAITSGFRDPVRVRNADLFLTLASLLLGLSAGLFLFFYQTSFPVEIILGLLGGWVVLFFLDLCLIEGVRSCIAQSSNEQGHQETLPNGNIAIRSIPQKLSGMHRIIRAMIPKDVP